MMKKKWCFLLCFFTLAVYAKQPAYAVNYYSEDAYEREINSFYSQYPQFYGFPLDERINVASRYFLGKPYDFGALGEGPTGVYDQDPLYRTDAFDCMTYVSTVLALANSQNTLDFEKNLIKIRYKYGKVDYVLQNHFVSIDWNKYNAKQGFIKDITDDIQGPQGKDITKVAVAYINKRQWFKNKNIDSIRLLNAKNPQLAQQKLKDLQKEGLQVKNEWSYISYIPLNEILLPSGQLNMQIVNQIPDGAIIEIIRPNWLPAKNFGTRLNVSHMGFFIKKDNHLYFRHASSSAKMALDVSFEQYLKSAQHAGAEGINIQQVM